MSFWWGLEPATSITRVDTRAVVAFGYPLLIDRDGHEASITRFRDLAVALCSDIRLYRFGRVAAPGLSDIDILCVVPDAVDPRIIQFLCEAAAADPVFTHAPFFVPLSLYAQLPYALMFIELEQIAGLPTPPLVDVPVEAGQHALHLAHVIDSALLRWLWFHRRLGDPRLPVRDTLLLLWSLRHLVRHFVRVVDPADDMSAFIGEVERTRTDWIEARRVDIETILRLREEGQGHLERLLRRAAARADALFGKAPQPPGTFGRGALLVKAGGRAIEATTLKAPTPGKARVFTLLTLEPGLYGHVWRLRQPLAHGSSIEAQALARRANLLNALDAFLLRTGANGAARPPVLLPLEARARSTRAANRVIAAWCRFLPQAPARLAG